MAYVPVPKDLSKIKTKVALNLTKRQLICFSLAGICGIPIYFLTKTGLGTDVAATLMVIVMLPFFFFFCCAFNDCSSFNRFRSSLVRPAPTSRLILFFTGWFFKEPERIPLFSGFFCLFFKFCTFFLKSVLLHHPFIQICGTVYPDTGT